MPPPSGTLTRWHVNIVNNLPPDRSYARFKQSSLLTKLHVRGSEL